jgi:polyphosphate kinase 2 (PPK2 family)
MRATLASDLCVPSRAVGRLDEAGTTAKIPKDEYEPRLERAQKLLAARRLELGGKLGDGSLGPPLCVLFEGWDASGKGGAIKRMTAELDNRHVRIKEFAAPTPDEKRHHYLARFVPALPGWGGMAILDRSWYGRVLVERVEGFASEEQWSRAYEEITEFETGLQREGMVLVKFWLHISAQEQLDRFERRAKRPLKAWKLTDEDWRNRDKRDAYCEALEDMFEHTDHDAAPWHIIPADSKKYTRVAVIEQTIAAAEAAMRANGIEPLDPDALGL